MDSALLCTFAEKSNTMSTIEGLKTLREREDHVEFKEAKHNYPFAGGKKSDPRERRHCVLGYVVALANERGGRLVMGMADAYPHEVVGSDFAEGETGALEDEIYLRLSIRVRTEELYETVGKNRLRVLVINVPSRPLGRALRFEGVPLMRVGESLREMDDAEYHSIISEQDPDCSARICNGLRIEDLDDDAIGQMRLLIQERRGRQGIMTMPLAQLLSDLRLATDEGLTYAALLLLGKSEAITKYLPQHNVVVEYRSTHDTIRYSARKEFREPVFTGIRHIWEYINQPASNPLIHVMDMPRILDVPSFNQETVREAILNACIHRSLQMTGDILVKQYPDMMEITNPGGFPYGVNIGNILTVNSSPRSRLMAEVIEKTGLIERSGQGVDIMYANCIREGRCLPDYSRSDDYQVSVVLKAAITDPLFYLFMQDVTSREEHLNVFMMLNFHWIHHKRQDRLYEDFLPSMLEKGYITEHPYFKYVLGEGYFRHASPVNVGVCQAAHLQRIYYCVEQYGGKASSTQMIEALAGLLSPKQVRKLIADLCTVGYLAASGNAKNTRYGFGINNCASKTEFLE